MWEAKTVKNIVFVGGIHGVGKTLFCENLSAKFNIPSLSAGKLISHEMHNSFVSDKKVDNINQNQEALLLALRKVDCADEYVLLNGHFCLINQAGTISRIPESTFSSLIPSGLIVLVDEVKSIAERLNSRDGIQLSKDFLEAFQQEELKYSKEIANLLKVPYIILNHMDAIENVEEFLEQIFLR
jgi:adenylate kinase